MKKLTLALVSIVCAVCCVFAFAACSGNKKEVKNEKEWKQYIAEARESDRIDFSAQISVSGWNQTQKIEVKVDGNIQYFKSGDFAYYYDGEYVYMDVSSEFADTGYKWEKHRLTDEQKSEFVEPKSYIGQIYSGEYAVLKSLTELYEVDLSFDGLDEISNRYADADLMVIEGIADGYKIEENNGMQDNKFYTVYFEINRNYSHVTYNASVTKPVGVADPNTGFYANTVSLSLRHEMDKPYSVTSLPTDYVKEVTAE